MYVCMYVSSLSLLSSCHSVVDMSYNRLDDPAVMHVLTAMPELVQFYTMMFIGAMGPLPIT